MSGLLAALHHNAQALNVHSKSLEITGKNLANINNPAYARQRVHIGSLGSIETTLGVQSMGISALALQHQRDALLDRQVQRDITNTSTLQSRRDALLGADAALGQRLNRSDDAANIGSITDNTGGGLSELLSSFFNAWESFSVRPNSQAEKILLLEKANALAFRINDTDSRLAGVQANLTNQINDDTAQVNRILETIANLNTLIAQAEIGNNSRAVDLRDQRQAKIEELAQYINFEANEQPNNYIHIVAAPGVDLVNTSGVQGTFAFNDPPGNFSGGSPPTILTLTGGSLNSRLSVRDGIVADLRTDLERLATQLTISVNQAYNPLNLPGENFFLNPPTPGNLIEVEATLATLRADAPGAPVGANQYALDVAALINQSFAATLPTPAPPPADQIVGTFSGHFAGMVARLGLDINTTSARLADQQIAERITRENRDSVSGVSQDEELTNMLRFQRTFQASARVTNVLDDLLELVTNRLGRF